MRSTDSAERTLQTYIAPDKEGNERIGVEIAPQVETEAHPILVLVSNGREAQMAKELNRITLAPKPEMSSMV